jgi:hypothetical protein
MLMQQLMKLTPQMEMIGMMAGIMRGGVAGPSWPALYLYGGVFVALVAVLQTDAYLGVGILLGAIGWLVAMMPMADKGVFGMKIGASLMMHVLFGALLGWVYGRLIT